MFFKYVPLLTTKDQEYAAKIRDVLAQNNIKCRTRSTNARINPAPNPGMPVGGNWKWSYAMVHDHTGA